LGERRAELARVALQLGIRQNRGVIDDSTIRAVLGDRSLE
jgi:hypothetical protein